jgi:uncharacterized membrane-anchored protein
VRRRKQLVDAPAQGVTGPARVVRGRSRSVSRLRAGDIAVLDHVDLDAATAEVLVARGVAAVVNAAPSTSGRYPNLGPGVLVAAGVPLLDDVGEDVFGAVPDGKRVRLDEDGLWLGERCVARGTRQDAASVAATAELAGAGLAAQLADLAENATGFLLAERDLLLEGAGLPRLATELEGRHVLVVCRGYGEAADLAQLRRYRKEHRPVLVGVGEGADALVEAGLVPQVVVGEVSTVSERALRAATDVVVGREEPARPRLEELGIRPLTHASSARSEDLALLLCAAQDARVIVGVGLAVTLEQMIDRGRADASASLLTRLVVGDRFVSASAAAAMTPARVPWGALLLLVLSAALACLAVLAVGAHGIDVDQLDTRWHALLDRLPW